MTPRESRISNLASPAAAAIAWLLLGAFVGWAQDPPTTGVAHRVDDLVLPGSELEARPLTDTRSPVVLRIVNVRKHGTAHRYDLVVQGLAPGKHDLRDYLKRKDGSSMDGVPPIPVEVRPAYAGPMRQVSDIALGTSSPMGGYRTALWVLGAVWIVGLIAILAVRRRKQAASVAAKPLTLADRLRPIVEKAARGDISQDEQAELERLLLGFWRRREGLDRADAAEALAELRRRETPGALLRSLEEWLHRPGTAKNVDVAQLLAPYGKEMAT